MLDRQATFMCRFCVACHHCEASIVALAMLLLMKNGDLVWMINPQSGFRLTEHCRKDHDSIQRHV